MDRLKNPTTSTRKPLPELPERVSELFMIDDEFFQSPFLRDKIPNLLFNNGANGLFHISGGIRTSGTGPFRSPLSPFQRFSSNSSSSGDSFSVNNNNNPSGVVRHIPIRVEKNSTFGGSSANINANSNNFDKSSRPSSFAETVPSSSSTSNRTTFSEEGSETENTTDSGLIFPRSEVLYSTVSRATTPGEEAMSRRKILENFASQTNNIGDQKDQQQQRRNGQFEQQRHFASLFWTPQQAKRIQQLEDQNEQQQSQDASQPRSQISTVTFFPIIQKRSLDETGRAREFVKNNATNTNPLTNNNNAQINPQTPVPYSAIPFRSNSKGRGPAKDGGIGAFAAISTPSLVHMNNLAEKPQLAQNQQSPMVNSATIAAINKPTVSNGQGPPFLRRAQTSYSIPPPPSQPQTLPRRDSEPAVVFAAAAEMAANDRDGQRSDSSSNRLSMHEVSTQDESCNTTNATQSLRDSDRGDGLRLANGGSLSAREVTRNRPATIATTTVNRAALPPVPPNSTRPKSPSIASLRQGLKQKTKKVSMVPSCVRGNGSDDENVASKQNNSLQKESSHSQRSQSPAIAPSALRLTEFVPSKDAESSAWREKDTVSAKTSLDSVEEAIRSLEEFDPNEYVGQQYNSNFSNSNGNSSGTSSTLRSTTPNFRQLLSSSPSTPVGDQPVKNQPVFQQFPFEASGTSLNHKPTKVEVERPDLGTPTGSLASLTFDLDRRSAFGTTPPTMPSFRKLSATTLSSGSGSVTPTGPPPPLPQPQLINNIAISGGRDFDRSFDSNRTPRATTPTSLGNNGNASLAQYQGNSHPHRSTSPMPSTHTVASYLPEMDQLLNRLKGAVASRNAFNNGNNNNGRFTPQTESYPPYTGPPPDYDDSGSDGERSSATGGSDGTNASGTLEDDRNSSAVVEAEAQLRKRFLCTQLTDCAKVVEINAMKMSQFASTGTGHGGWRQPHILRHNIVAIRDTIYTIEIALDELLESLARVSIDRWNPKWDELRQLSRPLYTSQAMIRKLRASLDSTGWSLPTLARSNTKFGAGQDALDQFMAILSHLPKDCTKLVQWVYQLGVWNDQKSHRSGNSTTAAAAAGPPLSVFLAPSSSPSLLHKPPPPPPAPVPSREFYTSPTRQPQPAIRNSPIPSKPYYSSAEDSPRNSANSVATNYRQSPVNQLHHQPNSSYYNNNAGNAQRSSPTTPRRGLRREPYFPLAQPNQSQQRLTPQPILKEDKLPLPSSLKKPSSLAIPSQQSQQDVMDGGESTTSSTSNGSVNLDDAIATAKDIQAKRAIEETVPPTRPAPVQKTVKFKLPPSVDSSEDGDEDDEGGGTVIMEEDDLMSVASESSVYDNPHLQPGPSSPTSSSLGKFPVGSTSAAQQRQLQKVNLQLAKSLTSDQRELFRLYEPQIVSHTVELCQLIEDFFTLVEEHKPAKLFFQKIQMIFIEAQSLVGIMRMLLKEDLVHLSRALSTFLEYEANRLDALLSECINTAKVAREEHKSVPAVQAMINAVVSVSQSAVNLKLFWKSCVDFR